MNKVCLVCGGCFETNHHRKILCSADCVAERNRIKALNWAHANQAKVQLSNKVSLKKRIESGKSKSYQQARRNTKEGYLDRFVERTRSLNPATDLTRSDLLSIFGDVCAVSGVPFKFAREGRTSFENPYSPSIDRINSKLPYQRGNVQIVLSAINFAKNAMTMEDFTDVWREITKSWAALTQGHY